MDKKIISRIFEQNKIFSSEKSSIYESIRGKQTPAITLVLCSDSRVPAGVVELDTINRVFCIENIGNQVSTAEGSIDYGILHLKTPLLVILGHTECGAVKASQTDYSGETAGIRRELDNLRQGLEKISKALDTCVPAAGNESERFTRLAELNVDYQVWCVVQKYESQIISGQLTVLGLMMDFTGSYGNTNGAIYITNINGDTNPVTIREKLLSAGIETRLIEERVKRRI